MERIINAIVQAVGLFLVIWVCREMENMKNCRVKSLILVDGCV